MPPIMSSIAYLLAILSSFFTWMNVGQLSLIAGANCAPSVAACDTGRASGMFLKDGMRKDIGSKKS